MTIPRRISSAISKPLQRHPGIPKWLLFGGSWGSTLALAYSEAHLERWLGFILHGIFLCRKSEINWFLYGLKNLFQGLAYLRRAPVATRAAATFYLPIKQR